MADRLEGYVEVNERIKAFYERYPEGTLQLVSWHVKEVGDKTFLIGKAHAYRGPGDLKPGVGHAWEPFPGPTPYTKDSELMNLETSCWGRALASLGFEVHRGIATKEDVQARGGKPKPKRQSGSTHGFVSPEQERMFKGKLKKAGATPEQIHDISGYASMAMTGGRDGTIPRAIDALMDESEKKRKAVVTYLTQEAAAWAEKQSDLPQPNLEGLPDNVGDETVPGDAEKVAF